MPAHTLREPFDMDAYMARFCRRSDLVSNQPKGISHLSKEDQLAFCLAGVEGVLSRGVAKREGV